MTSIKVKLRFSDTDNKEGTIHYQLIQNRIIRRIKTDYRLLAHEWDKKRERVMPSQGNRYYRLLTIRDYIEWDVKRLQHIIEQQSSIAPNYTIDDIIDEFNKVKSSETVFNFMQNIITKLQLMGKERTSEAYRATLRSFMHFRKEQDLLWNEFNSDLMLMYEAFLHNRRVTKNSCSFYMRILRAVYNRAVENALTTNRKPFKHVYTGVDKTVKRAIPLKTIKQIKSLYLEQQPKLAFARDMFLFSFYTRGMSFIDMAYLRQKDLANNMLSYRRRKTGQQLFIKWEKCMQAIIDKYQSAERNPYYLLPLLEKKENNQIEYKKILCRTNKSLKAIAKILNIPIPLTMYVARHSWASIAKSKNIPISIISEGMGHDSERTTQIYLASLDTSAVDKANAQILKEL